MDVYIHDLKSVEVREDKCGGVVIKLREKDGSWYGGESRLVLYKRSYEMLQDEILRRVKGDE